MLAGTGVDVERIDNQLHRGHTSPNSELDIFVGAVGRKTIFEELHTIAQNILGDVAQVEIELTAAVVGIVDEGVHHPELDVFVVGSFEVGIVELAHNTTPTGLWVVERAAGIHTTG